MTTDNNLSAEEFNQEIHTNEYTIYDIRTESEVLESGWIPNAEKLDFYSQDFEEQLVKLPKDTKYLIYCRSGNRSGKTIELMNNLGFTHVAHLDGGIQEWIYNDYPVQK